MTEINAWLAEQDDAPAAPDRAPDRAPIRDWLVGTNEEARLRLAANEGIKTDPERAARVLRLQYRTGLDAPFLDRNLDDVEYEAAKKGFDVAKFRRESPLVAEWLAKSPSHYAAAQDDTPALGYVERQWAYIKDQGQRGALTVELSDIGTAAFLGAATADQRRRQRDIQTQMAAANDYGITGFFEQIPGAVANQLPILATTLGAQAAGAVAGGATGAVGGAAGGAAVGAVVGATAGGVGALPGAAAGAGVGAVQGGRAGALAGWRLGAALSAAKLEASLAFLEYEEIRNDDGTPLDPSEARGAALVVGAINGALEGLTGIERLTEKIPGIAGLKRDGVKALVQSPTMRRAFGQFAGQIIKTAGVEGLTEALQSLVTHAIGELTALSQDKELRQLSPTEIMSRLIDGEAMAEALAEARAGAQGGGGLAAVVTTPELISEITKARRAQQNGAAFAELGKGVEASKLRERSPEALREVLETIEAKGDGKNVYVDAETFTRYFQEQGIDARALAEDLTGSAELYDEAIETGGEIEIPLAAYATKIAASEHGAAMARLLRARSGEMSQDEAERYFQTLDTREQESTATPTAPTDEIHASIQAQLLEAGHDAATATHYADLYQSVFAALGERGGVDPKTLFERYGLDRLVRRGAEASPAPAIDELDILLDRMRTGDRPQQMEAFGPTLIEFLRARGVRDDGGELAARDLDANLPRFARRIVRADGMSLDDAARAAVEAGYLSERSLTALLEAIDQEQSGRPIFAPQNENTGAASTLAALDEIQATLDELQIDVGSTPNEEIKKRLRNAYGASDEASTSQPDDEATRFDQTASDYTYDATQAPTASPIPTPTLAEAKKDPVGYAQRVIDQLAKEGISVLASRIAADFMGPARGSMLLGQHVAGAADLAAIAQVLRNPAFEVFRHVYVKDGVVVAQTAVSAHAADRSGMYPEGATEEEYAREIRETITRTGANGLWVMHNHPSGNPSPSFADKQVTRKLAELVPEFLGHVVINTDQYAEIDPRGKSQIRPMTPAAPEARPTKFHTTLGRMISGPEFAKDIATNFERRDDFFQVVGLSGGRVAGIAEVSLNVLKLDGAIRAALLRRLSRAMGAQNFIAINVPRPQMVRFIARTANAWTDVLDDTGASMAEAGRYFEGLLVGGDNYLGGRAKTRVTLFQDSTDEKRGYIEFGKDRKFSIRLLEKANLSTFLHESGHLFLEIFGDLAEAAGAKDQIKKDYESLLSYLGVSSRSEIQREHHEKFARTFESYLREGRAPSSSLRRAFAAFRAWLTWLYRTAKQLNVTLTPEVRGVLDRLVATDRAIDEAQQDADLEPLFLSADEAGMEPEEFERYRDSAQAASQRAQETVQAQIVRAFYREREAQYEEERAAVRKAVEAEINLRPEYIALAALQRGTTPEGEPLPVAHQKLSKADIIDAMGEPFLKRLPKPYVYSLKGGMSLARAAQQFGYRSGSELALALANAKPKDTVIDAETDSRMRERHKDIYRDGTIVDEARAALLNEHRESVMNLEMAALRKRANEARATQNIIDRERREQRRTRSKGREALRQAAIPPEHARATADAFIRKRRINQVHPMTYLRLMREASRRAVIRAANGDYDAAAADKQTEIFNYHMFRAASAAMSEVDDALAYFARLSKTQKRAKIGKAGSDYLEQIDGLLGRFNLRPMTAGQLDKKLALAEWIKRKEAAGASAGEEVSIDERIRNEAFKKHYSELSIDELIGLRDTIKQIDNMATLETNLTAAERKQTRDIAREELIAAAIANRHREKPLPYTVHGRKTIDKIEALGRMMDSSLIKMEQLIDWLDNGDIAGPWRTYLWEGAVRAQADEIDHSTRITARVIAAVNGVPKATRARMLDRVEVVGIERTLTRRDVIGVALNWGNASNRDKLLRGQQWTEEQVRRMLDVLTLEEWTFIQQVWDTLESLWPEIATLQREVTGLPPDKIEAQPVQTRYGTFRGGYYPVMYDPVASEQGALQLASTMGNLTEADYTRATTPKGHTKSRLQAFARPFNLDVDQLPFHVAGVIKDLTHRRWLIDANWLVNDSAIKQTLRDTLGPEYVPLFSEWTKQVINDRHYNSMASMNILRRFVEHFRYNTLIAAMGFKASTMLAQIAGLPNSIDVIGGHERDGLRWLGAGMGRALTAPRETYRLITEKSGEMRHRFVTRDRDLRDKLRLLVGRDDWFARVQQLALYGITLADMVISIPTWWGGYAKALSQGYSDSEAVSSGDRAVRLSQGAGGAKDLSSIAANRDLLARSITMFYTPFSALYSRLRDIGFQFKSNHDVLEMASRIFGVWITAAIVGELLAGRGPDDDEAIPEWALKLILIYPLLSVPVVRDGANAIISDYGYQFSPLAQAGKATAKALISAKNALTEDEADIEKLAVDLYRASKYWLGLPTGQIEITGGYLVSFADGSAEQDSLPDVIHGLIYRKEH